MEFFHENNFCQSIIMSQLSGFMYQDIIFSNVDFQEPEDPISAVFFHHCIVVEKF